MTHVLGANQYGKSETRVVRVYRDTARHAIRDLNVSTSLRGDFEAAHTRGDQAQVLPTDSQKNTAFAYAKLHGVSSPEDYALALGRRLLDAAPAASAAQIRVEEYAWDRIPVTGPEGPVGHDHSFVRRGTETRTGVVTVEGRGDGQRAWVVSGLQDLVVLKSTGSEFHGFLKDEYTTLPETHDRVMATSLTARWRHYGSAPTADADRATSWDTSYEDVKRILLATFAGHHSLALQQTLHAMGSAVLDAHPEIAEIRFSAPNKHHFVVDLSPFGIENDGEVFVAADRPYGLIEATITREDASDPGPAWVGLPGFC